MICHTILPRCQIKTTARTDFTGKYGLPSSEKTKKSFGSLLMTNRTDRAKNTGEIHFLTSATQAQKWQVSMAKRESLFDKAQFQAMLPARVKAHLARFPVVRGFHW
jgi:hypothetical protein